MTTYYRFILTSLGLLLCFGSFAQVLPYQQGSIYLNNGEKLTGFVSIANSHKVYFKSELEEKTKRSFKSKNVDHFFYDLKRFQAIEYKKSTFFVRSITQGQVSLYKRDFAPNKNKAYFIETSQGFQVISKANFYADLVENMSGSSVFDNYNEELFAVAYNYNQTDLSDLVSNYNLEKPRTMLAYDLAEPIDSLEEEILGFAVSSPSGTGRNGKTTRIPNTVRNDLALKSEVIYGQILAALKTNNWKKINIALKYLKPLANEIEAHQNKKIYSKMVLYAKQQEQAKFRKSFLEFVSHGVHTLMKSANLQKQPSMRKLVIRQAFVEFLEIKSELQKIDSALANKITNQFKSAFANAADSDKFKIETAKISASFKNVTTKV